jgi:hypothetical protein
MQNLTTTYDSMHIDLNKFNTHFVQVYVHGLSIWDSTSKNQLMFSNARVAISLIINQPDYIPISIPYSSIALLHLRTITTFELK